MALLEIDNLTVSFKTGEGEVNAVNGVSFNVSEGESLAIVGESGSGKSQTAFATMGLLAKNGWARGEARFDGRNLLTMSQSQLNKVRAEEISMIFQDPMTSLNPYLRVNTQMAEVLQLHKGLSRKEAEAEAVKMLDAVHIPDAKNRIRMFPHEFSGGMRQRIMIAMALLCRPRLLIADEPTTALDVTVQAQIMKLLDEIRDEFNTAIVLITHDLGIVADLCDRTMVMYGGQIMEQGPSEKVFDAAAHPYTEGLLKAVPRLDRDDDSLETIPGEPPDMSRLPEGCPFTARCPYRREECPTVRPELVEFAPDRTRACHAPVEEVMK